jgi:CubicO group peptidase (beta-lactamase class C family)
MEELIRNRLQKAIHEKIFPGCIVGIVRRDGWRKILPSGSFTYEDIPKAIKENSIFDVASITKSIPTSCLALKLIDEEKLSLEDRLIDFVPEFGNRDRTKVRIKHLLTQTLDSGLRLSLHKDKSPDEILDVIFQTEFRNEPGTKYDYTNATSILLGLVVERIYGDKLDRLAEKYFFKPLQMKRTSFDTKIFDKDDIVPTEIDPWRGRTIQGEVHDESAFKLQTKYKVGSAGLFSTASDVLNFLEMLLNFGSFDGHQYFRAEVVRMMYENQLGHIGERAGLGWELDQKRYMGQNSGEKTFGKTGFTGCVCICDIPRAVAWVILSNYSFPTRKNSMELINQVRRDISDIVLLEHSDMVPH